MKKKDLDKCWDIIWSLGHITPMFNDGLTQAQQDRITKALNLAYKKGKSLSKRK